MKRLFALISGWTGAIVLGVFAVSLLGVAFPSFVLAQSVPSSCPSASAQDTLNSSLQQLAELADTLLVENLPQTVISADQNLVSAISQAVLQIAEACLPSEPSGPSSPVVNPSPTNPISPITQPTTPVYVQPQLSLNGATTGSYAVGAVWMLTLTSSFDNTSFTLCDTQNGSQSCTPNWGTTNASGNWSGSGDFDSSTVGSWTEWAVFPSGATSTKISFTIAPSESSPTPGNIITGVQGYDPTTLAYTDGTVGINAYLILYGNFASVGNTVAINGTVVVPTYQSVGQINISLDGGISPATQNTVTVTTPAGATGSANFTITAGTSVAPTSTAPTSSTPPAVSCSGSPTMTTSFPVTILVTAATLNVRSAPNTSASLAGSGTLSAGNTFTATNEVQGGCFNNNNLWWVSSLGNYVWAGGTSIESTPPTTQTPPASPTPTPNSAPTITGAQGYNQSTGVYETQKNTLQPGDTSLILYGNFASSGNTVHMDGGGQWPEAAVSYQSTGQINVSLGNNFGAGAASFSVTVTVANSNGTSAPITVNGTGVISSPPSAPIINGIPPAVSLPAPVTKTITSSGVSYSITYSYLPDGEVRATFVYKSKPYAVQNWYTIAYQGLAAVQSNGSFSVPWTGVLDPTLVALAAQITGNSPPNQVVFPGFAFDTPLYFVNDTSPYYTSYPANVFLITTSPYSNVPSGLYYLDTDANGDLVGVTPVNVSDAGAVTTGAEIMIPASSQSGASPTTGGGGVGGSSEPVSAVINYCAANPFDAYCAGWLYCSVYSTDPACVNVYSSCPSNSTNPSCPTSIPASTPTASPVSTAPTTLEQICANFPNSPDCSSLPPSSSGGSGSCTPGDTQDCDSTAANACGMLGSATQTCNADGAWNACTAVAPPDSDCSDYCDGNSNSSCQSYCEKNPDACVASSGSDCTPGDVMYNCESSSNSCGMTNLGTDTCGSDGIWDGCSAEPPSDGDC